MDLVDSPQHLSEQLVPAPDGGEVGEDVEEVPVVQPAGVPDADCGIDSGLQVPPESAAPPQTPSQFGDADRSRRAGAIVGGRGETRGGGASTRLRGAVHTLGIEYVFGTRIRISSRNAVFVLGIDDVTSPSLTLVTCPDDCGPGVQSEAGTVPRPRRAEVRARRVAGHLGRPQGLLELGP
jgi:hypothetical protein